MATTCSWLQITLLCYHVHCYKLQCCVTMFIVTNYNVVLSCSLLHITMLCYHVHGYKLQCCVIMFMVTNYNVVLSCSRSNKLAQKCVIEAMKHITCFPRHVVFTHACDLLSHIVYTVILPPAVILNNIYRVSTLVFVLMRSHTKVTTIQ